MFICSLAGGNTPCKMCLVAQGPNSLLVCRWCVDAVMQSTPCEKFGECVFCAHYVSANACVQCRMPRQYLPTRQSISNRGWPVQVYNPSVMWVRANSLSVRFVAPSGRPGRSGNGRAWGKSERPHCKQLRRGFAPSSYRSLIRRSPQAAGF